MRRTITTITLIAVLGTVAVSCQKETFTEETTLAVRNNHVYMMGYSIDGVTHRVTLHGDNALDEFLRRMVALAEEGHEVSFRNEEAASQSVSSKETITYTTSNYDYAVNWSKEKTDEGYTVTITYDKETQIYTCTAVK